MKPIAFAFTVKPSDLIAIRHNSQFKGEGLCAAHLSCMAMCGVVTVVRWCVDKTLCPAWSCSSSVPNKHTVA